MKRNMVAVALSQLFVVLLNKEYRMTELPGTYVRQYIYHIAINGQRILTHRAHYIGGLK